MAEPGAVYSRGTWHQDDEGAFVPLAGNHRRRRLALVSRMVHESNPVGCRGNTSQELLNWWMMDGFLDLRLFQESRRRMRTLSDQDGFDLKDYGDAECLN